jgi:hypothetical protein
LGPPDNGNGCCIALGARQGVRGSWLLDDPVDVQRFRDVLAALRGDAATRALRWLTEERHDAAGVYRSE